MPNRSPAIRELVLDFTYPERAAPFTLQEEIKALYLQHILPTLEKVINTYGHGQDIIRILHLEIELGKVHPDLLALNLEEALQKELEKLIGSPGYAVPDEENPVAKLTPRDAHWELIRHFLDTGSLPWWGQQEVQQRTLPALFAELLERVTAAQQKALQKTLSHKRATKRLVVQFPLGIYRAVVSILSKQDQANEFERVEAGFLRLLEKMGLPHPAFSAAWARIHILQYILQFGAQQKPPSLPGYLLEQLRQAGQIKSSADIKKMQAVIAERPAMYPETWQQALWEMSRYFDQQDVADVQATTTSEASPRQAGEAQPQEPPKRPNDSKEEPPIPVAQRVAPFQPQEATPGEEWFVANAGLVLYWPYLPAFFEALNLIEEKDFVDEFSRQRAVHILHFLATEEEEPPEYLMLLPKLLCGFDLEEPIEKEIQLTDEEKQVCEELSKAVIQNWPALKNTSTASLRHSFIQRAGKLSQMDQGWLLQVEEHGVDVLLDKLPWGISVVSLSWIDELIHVEW